METKFYKRKFIASGIVGYDDTGDGNLLLKKSVIDEGLKSIIKKPVIITHEGKEAVGEVVDAYFNQDDDSFICGFNIWNKEAIDLLDNKGYGISCSYNILKENKKGGTYHNIPYRSEAEAIDFTNIAIVEKPRYEEAREVMNSIVENGGAGSGNWGHKGRPGKIGGSSKDTGIPSEHQKERQAYGRRLAELSKVYGASNISKKAKAEFREKVRKIIKSKKHKIKSLKPTAIKTTEEARKYTDEEIKILKESIKDIITPEKKEKIRQILGQNFYISKNRITKLIKENRTPEQVKRARQIKEKAKETFKVNRKDEYERYKKAGNEIIDLNNLKWLKPVKETEKAILYQIPTIKSFNGGNIKDNIKLWIAKSQLKDGKIERWKIRKNIEDYFNNNESSKYITSFDINLDNQKERLPDLNYLLGKTQQNT